MRKAEALAAGPALRAGNEPRSMLRRLAGAALARPLDTLAGVALAGGAIVIAVNALALQEGRHPAPIFSAQPARPAPGPARAAGSAGRVSEDRTGSLQNLANVPSPDRVRAVQEALVATGKYDGPVDGVLGPKTHGAILAYELLAGLPPTGEPSDALLAHLRGAKGGGAALPRPKAETALISPRVLAAQKALLKLGYGPMKADGIPGTSTRQALMKFEADRKLPVTGELSVRTARELASSSGIAID